MDEVNRPAAGNVRFRDSIRWKLEITIVGIIVALVVILTVLQIDSQQESLKKALSTHSSFLKEEMVTQADRAAAHLSRDIQEMITPFRVAEVSKYVQEAVKDVEDLQYIILMQGTLPRVAYGADLDDELKTVILSGAVSAYTARQQEAMKHEFDVGGHAFMESVMPIQRDGEHWGVLRLGFSLDHLNQTLADSQAFVEAEIRNGVIRASLTALLFLVIATVAVFTLTSRWIGPIRRLVGFSHELAGGNFSARPHISVRTNDEVGVLTASLEEMAASLKDSYAKLEEYSHTLEQRVEQRTSELATARDRAIQADRSKSEFLSNMSHEIRTPMNAIIGLSHLLLDSEMSRQQRDYQLKIQSAAQSLLGLINDILDFSKIEAGRLEMERVEFELADVFDSLFDVMGSEAEKRGLSLSFNPPDGLPPLLGDPLRLEQVLRNLLSNAIKFTNEGSVSVDVETESRAEQQLCLRFDVRDTGIGISEEQQTRLFKPFSQADASTTRKYGGTGLGLAISKQLVEMMDGEISVESSVGVGSCFSFTARFGIGSDRAARRAKAEKKERRSEAPASESYAPPEQGRLPIETGTELKGLRLLVAEDNEINQLVVEGLLGRAGIDFVMVGNGEQALQALSEGRFDAVIMDMHMPVMNGLEATRLIRQQSASPEIPIIAMTASAMQGDRERCLAAGMNDYIAKPVDPDLMYAVLRRWLRPEAGERTQRSAARAPAVETAMPVLEGIETAEGLNRLGGDQKLYRRLLQKYHTNYADAGERLGQALAAGDVEAAQHLAHSLKSVSGNIGARAVQQSAGEVEAAIRQGGQVDAILLERLQQGLAEVIAALDGEPELLADAQDATPAGDEVGPLIKSMREMLGDYDSHALELLEQLQAAMDGGADSDNFRRLKQLIERYDFDAALAVLAQLEEEIGK